MRRACTWVFAAVALLASGCEEHHDDVDPGGRSDDLAAFAAQAQPTLARSCAFPACHGDFSHGLALYAIGRTRAIPDPSYDELQFAALTSEELRQNLESSLHFVDPTDPDASELLRRGLPVSEGDRGHGGGVLFPTRDDPGYQALRAWIVDEVKP